MPSIIRDEKQFQALGEIESALKTVSIINQMMHGVDEEMPFQLQMVPKKGKPVCIDLPETEVKTAFSMLEKMKGRLAKEVRSKANKHRIDLDKDDIACLEGAVEDPAPTAD